MSRRHVSVREKASAIVFAELAFGVPVGVGSFEGRLIEHSHNPDLQDRAQRRKRWERRKRFI